MTLEDIAKKQTDKEKAFFDVVNREDRDLVEMKNVLLSFSEFSLGIQYNIVSNAIYLPFGEAALYLKFTLQTLVMPFKAKSWKKKAEFWHDEHKYKKERANLKIAQLLDKKDSSIWMQLANSYYASEEYDKAVQVCQEARIHNPNSVALLNIQAVNLLRQDKNDEAQEIYKKFLDENKPYEFLFYNLCCLQDAAGASEKFEKNMQILVKDAIPERIEDGKKYLTHIIEHFREKNDENKTQKYAREFLRIGFGPEIHQNIELVELAQLEKKDAFETYNSLFEHTKNAIAGKYNGWDVHESQLSIANLALGRAYAFTNNFEMAKSIFNSEKENDSYLKTSKETLLAYGLIAFHGELDGSYDTMFKRTIKDLESIAQANPNNKEVLLNLEYVNNLLKENTECLKQYDIKYNNK